MKKLFIRPGHGGSDSGAIFGNLVEKAMNLVVATKLAQLLAGKFEIKLVRTTDVFVDLGVGVDMANQWLADLFVSIHHNAGGGDGYEVYHSIGSGAGTNLANCIAKYYNAAGQNPHGQGVRTRESEVHPGKDYYFELGNTRMPAVISEYAYIDSSDRTIVDTMPELDAEAVALAKGICEYAGIPFEVATIPVPSKPATTVISDPSLKGVQRNLNRLKIVGADGKPLIEDGLQGKNTTYAIRMLQYIANVSVDGFIGPQTFGVINSILEKPVCRIGKAPVIPTRYLQWRFGNTKDGVFGNITRICAMNYQTAHGLASDGVVGPATWSKLIG